MLAAEPPGAAVIDAMGESPRGGERHAICMVCDFFYPHMGVRLSLYIFYVCYLRAPICPELMLVKRMVI